ncbi:MAG: hypothetical protein ACLRM9_07640 [Collinsella aerofaciens]
MTDELDPQTQQHIDHSRRRRRLRYSYLRRRLHRSPATADAHAGADKATDTDDTVEHDESEQPEPSDAELTRTPPRKRGPHRVSSEEELDAVMDSMMDAVKAMKDAVADAGVDAEEEEAAEAASTFVPGETPVADQGSTMPSFLQLEHPTIGADAVDPHAAGFSVVEGGTGNISVPQAADADAADTARPTASHSPAANRDLGTAVSNTANAVGTFIAQGASAMRDERRERHLPMPAPTWPNLSSALPIRPRNSRRARISQAATSRSSPTSARRLPRPKRLQRPPRLTVMPTPPKRQSSRVSSNK